MSAARLIALACLAVLASLAVVAPSGAGGGTPAVERLFVPGEVLVRFKPGTSAAARTEVLKRRDVSRKRTFRGGLELVRLDDTTSVGAVTASLVREPAVIDAQPNFLYRVAATPNDVKFPNLWGLQDITDVDVDAPEAWDISTGSPSVVAAVVDTGVEYGHADLAPNIWTNPGETANGFDDDGNGLVDDVRGWDFVEHDATPTDPFGHGTHVAGTIGARGNNAIGVTGVNWQVSLLPLRAGDEDGYLSDSWIISAFNYACAKGAKVINGSFGGPGYSPAMLNAINNCPGALFVVAAGNDGENIDSTAPTYPCAYTAQNLVCVAASDELDLLASFSNYGQDSVDLAAPGVNILSTTRDGDYAAYSGTSMATPHVAGAAALLWAAAPLASPRAIKYSLLKTVDPRPAFFGTTVSSGRLNVQSMMIAPVTEPPPAPTPPPPPPPPPPVGDDVPPSDPSPVSTSHPIGARSTRNVITMTWAGAFDQGGVDGYSYLWDSGPRTVPDGTKDAEETVEGAMSSPLPPGTYYFHLRTRDNWGNWSPGVHVGPYIIQGGPALRQWCVVPRVVGRTLAAAKTALVRAKCRLGPIARRRSRRVRAGRVVAQSRRAGIRLAVGSRVALTVSRGRR